MSGQMTEAKTDALTDKRRIDVMTLGETMAVVAPARPEPLEMAADFILGTAGAESNVAQYLAERGHKVAWASRVGDDALGRRLAKELAGRGIDLSYLLIDPDSSTGVMFKDPGTGATKVQYYRANSAASLMGPELADTLPWHQLGLLHLSGITPALSPSCRAMMQALFSRAAQENVPVSFDINFREALWPASVAAPVLLKLAQQADFLFVGLDEAQALWPNLVFASDVRALIDRPKHLIVKDGAVGATEYDGLQLTFVPAARVDVVEAVGAGDAFAAGYLSSMLDGGRPTQRLGRGHEFAGRALRSISDFQAMNGTVANNGQ
ncbi:sugar kinase [Arthrobacter sp. N199823]|uniref:sugar kinase n=1 Tax=Arthrobacter sp. N199823 TaxID=2058895 RepID=UPI00215844E3|nr:sugar kinase [Arthrobacter sp. N199823]